MNLTLNSLKSFQTLRTVNKHSNLSSKSVNKLTSGKSINIAADNPSNLALNININKSLLSKNQYNNNIQDGISMLETAGDAISTLKEQITRIKTLALQAANETTTFEDRKIIQNEINEILNQINRQTDTVHYNEINLLKRMYIEDLSILGPSNTGIQNIEAGPSFYIREGVFAIEVFEPGPENPTINLTDINTYNTTVLEVAPDDPMTQDLKSLVGVFGQKFAANHENIASVDFKLANHSGNITVELYSDMPESNLLGSATINNLNIGAAPESVNFDFTSVTGDPIEVTKGANYFLTIKSDSPTFEIVLQNPADAQYADGYIYRDDFIHLSDSDLDMKINAKVPVIEWTAPVEVDAAAVNPGNITMEYQGNDIWTITQTLETGGINTFNYTAGDNFNQNGIQFNLSQNEYLTVGDKISYAVYRTASFNGGPEVRIGANETSLITDNQGNQLYVTFGNNISEGTDNINVALKEFETIKFQVSDTNKIDTGLPALFSAADLEINDINVLTTENCNLSLEKIDKALEKINSKLAFIGSIINKFEKMINFSEENNFNLSKVMSNLSDTDYYSELTNYYNKDLLVKSASYMNQNSISESNNVKDLISNVFGS